MTIPARFIICMAAVFSLSDAHPDEVMPATLDQAQLALQAPAPDQSL